MTAARWLAGAAGVVVCVHALGGEPSPAGRPQEGILRLQVELVTPSLKETEGGSSGLRQLAPASEGAEAKASLSLLRVTEQDKDFADQEPRIVDLVLSGRTDIALPPGKWIGYFADVQRFWVKPFQAELRSGETTDQRVVVHPTGFVQGLFQAPVREQLPETLEVIFERSKRGPPLGSREPLWGRRKCVVSDSRWRCALPAGKVDLRLMVEGFSDLFLWGVVVKPGGTVETAPETLQRGSVVFGWVARPDGEGLEGAEVSLSPATFMTTHVAGLSFRTLTAQTDAEGFFSLAGVPDGEYVLTASHGPVHSHTVNVRVADGAVGLDQALVLYPPSRLEVYLDPPLAPSGETWRAKLYPVWEKAVLAPIDGIQGTPGGVLEVEVLAPGEYLLIVEDALDGSKWHTEKVPVEGDRANRITVEIPVLAIEGRVLFGEKPVPAAELQLESESKEGEVRLKADEDGRFEGAVRGEGRYTLRVEAAGGLRYSRQVELGAGPDGVAELEIEIPATRLAGSVRARDSSPLRGATITVAAMAGAAATLREELEDLTFEFVGLPPGTYSLSGEGGGIGGGALSSLESVIVTLRENSELRGLEVVLDETIELQGRIVSSVGQPVPGTQVVAWSLGGIDTAGLRVADGDGRFTSMISRPRAGVNVVLEPPGHPFTVLSVSYDGEHPIEIPLSGSSGQLRFFLGEDYDPWDRESAKAFLFHRGGVAGIPMLERWATVHGGSSGGSDWLLPSVETGLWELCLVPAVGIRDALARPAFRAPSWRCDRGELLPQGELSLSVASPDHGPSTLDD